MKAVFLDTVGLLALWDKSDQWHDAATTAFAAIQIDRTEVVTTTFVLAECANAAARRPYRLAVARLRDRLEAAGALIVPTKSDWREAWEAYRLFTSGQAGLVDQISFVVMRRLGLSDVFGNDTHFRAAGMTTLF